MQAIFHSRHVQHEDAQFQLENFQAEIKAQMMTELTQEARKVQQVKTVLKAPREDGNNVQILPKKRAEFSLDQCLVVSLDGNFSKLETWNGQSPSNTRKMDHLLEDNVRLSKRVQKIRDELQHQRELTTLLKCQISVVTNAPTDNQIETIRTEHSTTRREDLTVLRKVCSSLRKELLEIKARMNSQTDELECLRRERPILQSAIAAAAANFKQSNAQLDEQATRVSIDICDLKTQIEQDKQRFMAFESQVSVLRAELENLRRLHALDQEIIGELHFHATILRRSTKKFIEWVRENRKSSVSTGCPGLNAQVLYSMERIGLWLQDISPPLLPLSDLSFYLPSKPSQMTTAHLGLKSEIEEDENGQDDEGDDDGFTAFTTILVETLQKDRLPVEIIEQKS